MRLTGRVLIACVLLLVVPAGVARAQDPQPGDPDAGAPEEQAPSPAEQTLINDLRLDVAQPDFTLAALPTTLRLPARRWGFRVTHRFTRPLGQGSFGKLLGDFFGFDSAALVGLELRYGLAPGMQVGIHRTSGDKTIQFFSQYSIATQGDRAPFGLNALVTVEGRDNFKEAYAPAVGALLSWKTGDRGAFYVEPIWVGNTNPLPAALARSDHTMMVGLGTRLRLGGSRLYVVLEAAPRIAGHDPGITHAAFAIERRVGLHSFQVNVSNSFATTIAQVARGGFDRDDWYIGFNISRKFY